MTTISRLKRSMNILASFSGMIIISVEPRACVISRLEKQQVAGTHILKSADRCSQKNGKK